MTTECGIYEYAKHGLELSADKTALWFYGKSITYRTLFEKIDNVADNLYALGVREGTVVTIHLPNCPQAVMAIYAVAKLGGICNMVHAQTPAAALRENLIFTESDFLITYLADCTDIAKTTLYVDISHHMGIIYRTGYRLKSKSPRPKNILSFESIERACPHKAIVPEQKTLAEKCVAYFNSSGTTGKPKTVMHCHKAINNWVANALEFVRRDSMRDDRRLGVLPMFHGSGVALDMHWIISGGGALIHMATWDANQAVKFIEKLRVTSLTGVPKMYHDLLRNKEFSGKSIRYCYVSGDNVGESLKIEFNKRVNQEPCIYEGYGMTETVTACFSCGEFKENISASGYPLSHCEVAVINKNNVVSPIGEGELIVSANTMMMGYFKDEETTHSVFTVTNGKRWFRTGDYGRIDGDGYIYFIERIKNVIIHNGYNVFPLELEAVTQSLPDVEESCIVGITDRGSGTQQVRAYIVIAPGVDPGLVEKKLKDVWMKKLPRYAIPQQIRFMSKLPRNSMAKIDRKVLEQIP